MKEGGQKEMKKGVRCVCVCVVGGEGSVEGMKTGMCLWSAVGKKE